MAPSYTKIITIITRMSDVVTIITAICAGLAPLATIISSIAQGRVNRREFAKQSIFRLIDEDKTEALYGKMPENYQNVLAEYDQYSKNGGNSYVTEKVEAYKKWYAQWQAEHIDKTPKV